MQMADARHHLVELVHRRVHDVTMDGLDAGVNLGEERNQLRRDRLHAGNT
jgi:hypothetical protein